MNLVAKTVYHLMYLMVGKNHGYIDGWLEQSMIYVRNNFIDPSSIGA